MTCWCAGMPFPYRSRIALPQNGTKLGKHLLYSTICISWLCETATSTTTYSKSCQRAAPSDVCTSVKEGLIKSDAVRQSKEFSSSQTLRNFNSLRSVPVDSPLRRLGCKMQGILLTTLHELEELKIVRDAIAHSPENYSRYRTLDAVCR